MKKVIVLMVAVIMLVMMSFSVLGACVNPPSGLVSWWPGEGNANDVIGGFNGELKNGATFVDGKVGKAFSFDGVNDYVDVEAKLNTIFNTPADSDFSLSFWAKAANQNQGTIFKAGSFKCNVMNNLFVDCYVWQEYNTSEIISLSALQINTWNFITFVFNKTNQNLSLYVNGVEISATIVISLQPLFILNMPATIGGTTFFNGSIDELTVWNRPLSAVEIKAIYYASDGMCKPVSLSPLDQSICNNVVAITNTTDKDLVQGITSVLANKNLINPLQKLAAIVLVLKTWFGI